MVGELIRWAEERRSRVDAKMRSRHCAGLGRLRGCSPDLLDSFT